MKYLLLYFYRSPRIRRMNYQTVLETFKARREKIRAFLATGKTHEQAALRFKVTRQRIQQIANEMRRTNGS